ncbi:MAG: hypothetical protein J6Z79_04710 [Clostridia bacterium]|nr:hypothetical protein [Clostridia bacterium]
MAAGTNCEECLYYDYADDEGDEMICTLDLDEDEMERLASGHYKGCPYFRDFDEYKRVRKQN